jgi:hypothetical protein
MMCRPLVVIARFVLLVMAAGLLRPVAVSAEVRVNQQASVDGAGTITTPAFATSSPGELLVAFVASDGPATGRQTLTVSGAGLPWSLVRRANAQAGTAEIWTARASGVLSNVTVTSTQSIAGYHQSLTVVTFVDGAVGGSGTASAAGGAATAVLTTTQAGSLLFGVGHDWENATARTIPAGQAMLHQKIDAAVGDTFWVQRRTDPIPVAGMFAALGVTAPIAGRWNFASIEVVPTPPDTAPVVRAPTALDQLVSADGRGTLTTPAFNTSAPGELLVAFAASDGPTSGGQTLTINGAGLTWSLVRRVNAQLGTSEIWTARHRHVHAAVWRISSVTHGRGVYRRSGDRCVGWRERQSRSAERTPDHDSAGVACDWCGQRLGPRRRSDHGRGSIAHSSVRRHHRP